MLEQLDDSFVGILPDEHLANRQIAGDIALTTTESHTAIRLAALDPYNETKILCACGINVEDDVDSSRKASAQLFVTDSSIGTNTTRKAYALRWSIEVYFIEANQYLGYLKEQKINFVSHTASIHRCVSLHQNESGSYMH